MKRKLSDLVIDMTIYPRMSIDKNNIDVLFEALRAGAKLPAIVVDKQSLRIIDGVHRFKAYQRQLGAGGEIDVQTQSYDSERSMFLDAVCRNASHGKGLQNFDRVRVINLGEQLGIEREQLADALHLTLDRMGELMTNRMANDAAGAPVQIKRTIAHMAGKPLNPAQVAANKKLSGMQQIFYVNQVAALVENDLIDAEDEALLPALQRLSDLLKDYLANVKAA